MNSAQYPNGASPEKTTASGSFYVAKWIAVRLCGIALPALDLDDMAAIAAPVGGCSLAGEIILDLYVPAF